MIIFLEWTSLVSKRAFCVSPDANKNCAERVCLSVSHWQSVDGREECTTIISFIIKSWNRLKSWGCVTSPCHLHALEEPSSERARSLQRQQRGLLVQFVARAPRKRKARPESCTAGERTRLVNILLLLYDLPARHGASWPENVAAWSATSDFPETRE
jgi:hypothetical protein